MTFNVLLPLLIHNQLVLHKLFQVLSSTVQDILNKYYDINLEFHPQD